MRKSTLKMGRYHLQANGSFRQLRVMTEQVWLYSLPQADQSDLFHDHGKVMSHSQHDHALYRFVLSPHLQVKKWKPLLQRK
jgi:hypothetical protein